MKGNSFLLLVVLVCEILLVYSQTSPPVYHQEPVPNPFTLGTRYPNRDEDVECRPIKLRVRRNSLRFHATITQNSNSRINFETSDASLMTSRMKSRLDILASWYYSTYGTQLRVLMSYIDGNDPGAGTDSSVRSNSLHYEGRSARIRGSVRSQLPAIARQAVLSGFDWVYYADQDYCRVSVIPDICQTDIDLVFLVDESGSVGSSNYQLAVQFMQSVVNFFDVEANRTRVAMISFSTNASINFFFSSYLSNQAVNDAIGRTRYSGGYTHTAWALYFARLMFHGPNLDISGARPLSAGIPRVVVLITDGHSNHYRVDDQAMFLREDSGATIYSVGIANYDIAELNLIASDPDSEHVFLLQSYSDAASFVQLLSGTTCDTPAILPPGSETDTECEEDDFRYFQIECPVFSDTVIVEQIDIVGHCAIYVSTTIVNPGPLNSIVDTVRNETLNVNRRRVTIRITSTTTSIYVSIRGITPIRNRFRMVVWNVLFAEEIHSVTVLNEVMDSNSIINLDVISGNDANYAFSITEGNEAGKFRIGSNTGQIYLTEALNAEQQDFYNLTVVAYLRSNDCQRGRTYVEVYVSAANQNSPIFQTTSPASVFETFPPGMVVVTVTATDADFGINGQVRYSITGGNTGNAFAIDPVTGVISVAAALNHTILSSYTLTLTATDQAANNPRTDTTTQVVNILDVNQSPFFLTACARLGACSLTVSEDRAMNNILDIISAGDPDLSTNGQLDYSITPTDTPFSINNRGRIRLVESLDRETQDTYLLNLTVSDQGSPPISITVAITYTVTDVNDNRPVVTIPSQVTISEGAFVGDGVLQASATDADIGVNAQVMYILDTGSPLFAIDASTGAIILARSLDYEQSTQHSIVVSASNPDGLSSNPRTSTVLVINENDNSPIFTMDRYTASVTEGSNTGTPVITVQADDADVGTLGEVSYSITSGNSNDNFAIDSRSGGITVNGNIDREVISEYTLTIRAQDGGSPARSDRSIVVVTINDVNDNSPIFQRSSYTITVREDVNFPADLLTLVATDADEAGSQNSAITYSIQTGNTGSVFNLATNTGILSVISSLDFESTPSYSLDVVATDGGSRTGNATVTVTITDVNDEAPTLSADQTVSLQEDTSTPRVIANFTASGETGEVLQFQLFGSQNGEFVIDMTTGEVSLVRSLDYESRQEFRLTVSVTDGQFSTSSRLTITVTDVNDNTPIIDSAGPFTIMEERPSNSLVGSVSASDRDSGSNAQLSFRITQQPLNLFTIVPDGGSAIQIRTATVLDREALVQMNRFLPPNSQSDITIEVSDNGSPRLTSSVTVVIRLEDINDNAPTLVNPVSEVNISEISNIGTVLTRVVASDVDIGVNALVSYSLTGSPSFTIDSSTGTITLVSSLDYETRREHMITVTASNPDRVRSPEHIIVVRVIDENDNSPIFTMDPYRASVEEHSDSDTPVVMVEAEDADAGILGEVEYSIISGNVGTAFSINETTGLISVNADTDRELISAYILTVAASNPGTSSQTTTSRVEITITDINDNPPLFMQSLYTLSLREDTPLVSILTVVVTDDDEPGSPNSQFVITISSGNQNGLFTISSPSGVLSLSSSLDFEVQRTHELNITATDRGIPSMSSTVVVQITVVNVNDNPPMISGNRTVQLNESKAVGSIIAQFTSTMEQGETLEFSIMSTSLLTIDSETGEVTLAQSLDYETQQSFRAQVSVSDGLFSSSAYLTVNVLDENDNAPQISPAGPFSITEEMPAGTLVGTVTATDADSVGGPLMFSFLGTDVLNFFNITSPNGEIRTANVLDREALTSEFSPPSSSRTFTVSVSDGTSSSTVDITFQLLDVNDNEPVFTNLLSQYDINENSAIGTEVFTVTATDADLGSNAVVSYSLSSSPFIINENTGIVTVNASLDYENVTEYSVTITASDGTLSSNRSITIGVIDVNDNAPVFSMSSYTAQVAEHSDINTSVTNISAADDDSGAFGMISYALEGSNGVFRIDSTTGEVVINQDVDRELITQFTFTVVASDGGDPAMSASSSVVVSISDINDNAPVFQQSSYSVRVREDTAVLTEIITILATDADEMGNPNSQIDYSFETSSSVFSISATGAITLVSSLDFEATPSYSLTAVATDRGNPMMSGHADVTITVLDVNDQPPVLTGDQSITLSELTAVPDQIARFTATSDAGEELEYELTGTQNGEFEINMTTGIVTLVQSLDYEGTQFYALRVTASDSLFSTPSAFNITVTDENDNIPQFDTVGVLEIIEEQSIGTRVGRVTASDNDSGENAMISYSFVQSSTENYFTMNSNTGEIVTADTLDRELLVQENLFLPPSSQITFQVQATDMGNPPLFSQIDVTVRLNDINDNRPSFVNSDRQVMIEESAAMGDSVTTVTATDSDLGSNALVSYALTGSSLFVINSTTGVISVAGQLDYEISRQHDISVTAVNPDGLASMQSHNITIFVTDVNDNSPIFTMDPYRAVVNEHSSTGTPVITVQADDADSGLLGQVRYSIGNHDANVFSINETSGAISVNGDTDREAVASYTFTVQATDSGSLTVRSAVATVDITIADINDNAPMFDQSIYRYSVREDTSIPMQLLTVRATDDDLPRSPNSRVSYSINNGVGLFEIDNTTGFFSVTSSLDFEAQSSYTIQVLATDNGQPSLTSTAQIVINVINVNDQLPQLSGDQRIELSELTTSMSRVTQYTATGEEGETLVFSLAGDGAGTIFDINSATGIVTLLTALDFETTPFYSYMITVSDGTFTSSPSSLNITILDENDNTPQFTSNNLIAFEEEVSINTLIGQINATDIDSGVNGQLSYSFVESRANIFFTINPSTGEISTAVVVDREGLAAMNALIMQSRIMFDVQVSDNGNPARFSTQTATFVIIDINDNAPELNPPMVISISEAAMVGHVVTNLSAVDRDLGENALISYSLTGPVQFTISSTTGVVTLASSLDYETSTEHIITVTASNPDGLRSTEHNITIRVIDENDNSPIFTMDPYRVSVEEHSSTGTPVITVQADDADSGTLGEVSYSITSGNNEGAFIMNITTGSVTVNSDIDREMSDAYTLGVMATDGGGRSAQGTVEITITDINDNSPVFNPSSYPITVYENASINSTLVTVIATDTDAAGPNSDINYSILSGNDGNLFRISSTGMTSIAFALDFETAMSHSLIVQATDNGTPSRSSTAVVSVTVMDVNDVPVTLGGDQVVNVSEYTTVNSRIAQFEAVDVEQSDNISYSLSGNQIDNFQIDAASGVVTLAQSLDYEMTVSYVLTVTVNDGVFSNSVQLTVNVVDENDNQPMIETTDALMIDEEMDENAIVGQVTATDGDSGLNGQVQFSIVSNIGGDLFTINASTGMIRTTAVLDREALENLFAPPDSEQVLVVQAEDRGTPSLFTQADVTIRLLDINDNSPQFVDEPSSISLPENIPVNTFILDASATDADLGANGEVSYSLTSDTSSLPFSIDPSTGAVTTTTTLDREQIDFYTITVTASDNGTLSRLTSSFIVNVTVTDINDNAPVFQGEPYGESIPEDASTDGGGSIDLLRVFAVDSDIGTNAIVTYSLAPDTNRRFSIRNTTGELRVSGGINFEEETEFNVTIIARDMGIPALSSTTIATITIINVDEFAPVFIGSCDASISEARNVSRDSNPVTQCIAVDQDSGSVDYSIEIEPGNPALSAFLLNQLTGEVFLTQSLDREIIESYQFTLQASSGGSLITRMIVTINITDVNDNAPVFSPSQIAVTYSDRQAQSITTLTVTDDDINENAEVSVDITSVVRTNQPDGLDTHEIIITAEDMGVPSMSGSATVVVTNGFPCQIMQFSLDSDTLQLSVATLCSLTNPPMSRDYLLGTEVILDCSAVSNLPVMYQWQLNGSFITNPSANPLLNLSRIDIDDIGAYSCIARTDVGSIQSVTAFIGINTIPEIIRPPESNAVEIGRTFSLTCLSTGIPDPTVTFFHKAAEIQLDSRVVQHEHFLLITNADEGDNGEYYCRAENVAGAIQSEPARIVVFSNGQVITTTILVNNPSDDGTCHNLDIGMIEDLLQNTTGYGAEVTMAEADGFCNSGPCYPNPCMNDGRCSTNENATGGYECACPDGFEGNNCEIDINECTEEDPCFGGTCANTIGGFSCTCPSDRTGHRCQYQVRCTDDLCINDTTCVETLVNVDGYVCDSTPDDMTLIISLSSGVSPDQLGEAVYDLTNLLVMSANTNRKRRQVAAASSDVCEPRFIPLNDDDSITFKLIWACPDDDTDNDTETTSASLEIQELICTTLLDRKIITDCVYSNGESTVTDAQTLDPIEVSVTFIMLDPVTNVPITGSEAVKVLGDTETLTAFETAGIQASPFTAAVPSTEEPTDTTDTTDIVMPGTPGNGGSSSSGDSGLGGGAIAGIVIGILIIAALGIVGAIAVLYYIKTHGRYAKYGINENKTASTLMRNIESGRDRTQTVVGVFENPTFRSSMMLETAIPDDKALSNNPAYQGAPKIAKLDGNTKPVDKNAINRL